MGAGVVVVGQSTYVLDMKYLEDVVYAYAQFNVGRVLIHDHCVVLVEDRTVVGCTEVPREEEEVGVGISAGGRVILIGKSAPEGIDAQEFGAVS